MRIKVKQMILIIVVSAVVYLVVGAMAPFIKYKEVSSQAGDSFRPEDFRSGETGMDRAMILETSQSAWEHRLRLLDGAKSRIIDVYKRQALPLPCGEMNMTLNLFTMTNGREI